MEAITSRWKSFIEWCKHPALPYEKFNTSGDVDAPNKRLYAALAAEFLGLMFFQLYGGVAHEEVAAFGNGLSLAVLIYATANVSGGHLNPAVTLSTMVSGHMPIRRGLAYMVAQYSGSIVGALLQVVLIPSVHIGMGNTGPGCFTYLSGTPIRLDQLFGWELVMTFVLCAVVHATAISKPGFGVIAPLAIGYTLFASAFIGGPFTGTALNPARVFAPTLIFDCYWSSVFVYMIGQYVGGLLCGLLMLPLYGPGPEYDEVDVTAGLMNGGGAASTQMAALPGSKSERQGLINVAASAGSSDPRWDARF